MRYRGGQLHLGLLLGCAPLIGCGSRAPDAPGVLLYESDARRVGTECGWSIPLGAQALFRPPPREATLPNRQCALGVLAALGADVPEFLAADNLSTVEEAYAGASASTAQTRLGTLLAGSRVLLAGDLGSLAALEPRPGIPVALVDRARSVGRTTGDDRLGWVLFDLVAGAVLRTEPWESQHLRMQLLPSTRILQVADRRGSGVGTAATLVHEAAHAEGFPHVDCAASSQRHCDADLEGACGFGLAVLLLVREHVGDDAVKGQIDIAISRSVLPAVNAFVDSDGRVAGDWRARLGLE